MENEVFEKDLSIRSTIGSNDFVRGVDAEGRSINYKRSAFSAPSSLTGLAKLTTKPGTPQENDLWFCLETGVYTFFDNITAEAGNYLAYKDSAWFLVDTTPLGYSVFDNIDPETLPIPSGGTVYIGSYQSKLWQKLNSGEILWYDSEKVSEDKQKFLAIAQGVEMNFRDSLLDEGGVYYSNEGLAFIAKLLESNLYKKANLIVTPAGTKVGTGAGDGTLYSVKGSNFTVDRAAKKSYTDIDGYKRFAAIDEATIDYGDNIAVINNAVASSNQILYPFSYINSYWNKTGVNAELDPTTAGSELVTNGDFANWTGDDPDGWMVGTEDTNNYITEDVLGAKIVGDGSFTIRQTILQDNISYKVELDVLEINGITNIYLGWTGSVFTITSAGHYVLYGQKGSGTSDQIIINQYSGYSIINNVSAKEVSGFASPFKDNSGNIINIAEKLVATASNPSIKLKTGIDMSATTNSAKTYFIKPINEKEYTLNGISINFDTETYGTGIKVTELADGWYELSLTETSSSADKVTLIGTSISSGDMCYLSGTQLEANSVTPFINDPADAEGSVVSSGSELNVADYNGDSESGVLFAELKYDQLPGSGLFKAITIWKDINNYISFRMVSSGEIQLLMKVGGNFEATATYSNYKYNEYTKIAVRWNNSTVDLYSNGIKLITDNVSNTFNANTLTNISLSNYSGGSKFTGNIKQLQTLSYLSDAEMVKLTTP